MRVFIYSTGGMRSLCPGAMSRRQCITAIANYSQLCYSDFTMDEFKQKLAAAGYKLTTPRAAVLAGLSKFHGPISARTLHKKINQVDRASVYRALNLFEELHLVNIELVEKEKLYCLSTVPHHHVICQKCGYTEEIICKHNFSNFKNFSNVRHRLTITGLCLKCQ